jgi:hypothetical protein
MPELQRKAPKGGYGFEAKALYRQAVWSVLSRGKPVPPRKRVLLMPSREGLEVGVAESFGIQRAHIYPVDANPAIIAHLTRDFPGMARIPGAHGVPLHVACKRLAAAGIRLHAANFDLTGQANKRLFTDLRIAVATELFAPHARVAVTMLRGRETSHINTLMGRVADQYSDVLRWMRTKHFGPLDLKPWDVSRILFAGASLGGDEGHSRLLTSGAYKSHRQTMIWVVFEVKVLVRRGGARKVRSALRFNHLLRGFWREADVLEEEVNREYDAETERLQRSLGELEELHEGLINYQAELEKEETGR